MEKNHQNAIQIAIGYLDGVIADSRTEQHETTTRGNTGYYRTEKLKMLETRIQKLEIAVNICLELLKEVEPEPEPRTQTKEELVSEVNRHMDEIAHLLEELENRWWNSGNND